MEDGKIRIEDLYEDGKEVNVNRNVFLHSVNRIERLLGVKSQNYDFELSHQEHNECPYAVGFVDFPTGEVHLPERCHEAFVLHEGTHWVLGSRNMVFNGDKLDLYHHLIEESLVELAVADILKYKFPSGVDFIGDPRKMSKRVIVSRVQSKDPSNRFLLKHRFFEDAYLRGDLDAIKKMGENMQQDLVELSSWESNGDQIGIRKIVASLALSNSSYLYRNRVIPERLYSEIMKRNANVSARDFYFDNLVPLIRGKG
ncbi:hypothetical protein CMI45_03085 [Candidatus Pacearchaeota archaeon]|jgi:hypothetical protein|nr:hypothetical protein [Candidatus Pacearchaeota archaeon]|tara:strand:- start:1572 stop:2339 length:768 start_codon:yes stop_codon:yes gene_type:complete